MMPDQSEDWARIDSLFERLLDSGDAGLLDQEPDKNLAEAVRKLYEQHLKATNEGFLGDPITLVRDLAEEDQPVFEQGQLLCSRFEVLRPLGAGGMGQVYLAKDRSLGETVALKTILPSLAREERFRKRFISEIQSARRVTHPNVCRIFDLFEHEGTPFCSMEYVEGESLSTWIKNGLPDPKTCKDIVIQLAEGLHAAHRSSVIHGDFKPPNVIVASKELACATEPDRAMESSFRSTGGPSGPAQASEANKSTRAVITDFGLARMFGDGVHPVNRSINAGTPEYLAPELAQGQPSTVRSDIYAFGKVASKLLPAWNHTCSAADPQGRPKSLLPVIRDLRDDARSRRWMMLAGVGAVAASGGWLFQSITAAKLPLQSRQRLIVNGFAAAQMLSEPANVLRRLLVVALGQSPLLAVLPDERLRAVLRSLERPAELPATLPDLSAAALRERAALILNGVISQMSNQGLELAVQVYLPDQQKAVFEVRKVAEDQRDLVKLVDRAANELRKEFGESRISLQSTSVALEEATSASPEAVDLYFRAVREYERTDTQAALALLDRAVEIDSQFAMAHHYRAMCLWASTQTGAAMQACERAFQLRNRVTKRERNWIEFFYYNLNGDFLRSLDSVRRNAILFPDEAMFQRNTASTYCQLRQFDSVIPYNVRAVELDPFSDNTRSEHLVNLVSCGKPDEAIETSQRYSKEGVSTTLLDWGTGLAHLTKGDYQQADACFVNMASTTRRERWARLLRAGPAILQGRFAETVLNLESDLAHDSATGDGLRRFQRLQVLSSTLLLMGETARARPFIETLCTLQPFGPSLRYLRAGARYALELGDFALANQSLEALREIERRWPSTHSQGSRAQVEGLIHAYRKEKEAEPLLTQALGLWPDPLTLEALAWWQGTREQWQAQNQTLDQLLRLRGPIHRDDFHSMIVLAWISLAESLARMSRFDEASRFYRRVLAHWSSPVRSYPVVDRLQKEFARLPK